MGIRFTVTITAFLFLLAGFAASVVISANLAPNVLAPLGQAIVQPAMTLTLLLVMAGLAIACIAFGVWVTKPIRSRLLEIEEAAVILGAGHLHHRVEMSGQTDEIGRLGTQFNMMSERIEHQVALLQKLADENRKLAMESEWLAALQERQRLARELHDSVSQQLFALTMLSSTALRLYTKQSPDLQRTLTQVSDLSNAAQREMRALLLHLRPVDLEGRHLVDASEQFLQAMQERYGLRCTIQVNVDEVLLSPAVEDGLFRILQEAAANVIKHAQATTMTVRLDAGEENVEMVILDDGVGIEQRMDDTASDSYGLRAMRERALGLGGQCEILAREHGTMVSVRVPLTRRVGEVEA